MKWIHREQPQETAAPGRREMPLLHPTADKGLTSAQAKALAEAGWDNRPVASPTKSDKQIVRENLLTYFNLIFVVLAIIGLPLLLLLGLLPWLLRIAGVVLLVKALFDKPVKWENFMPAIIAFVLSAVLGWIL